MANAEANTEAHAEAHPEGQQHPLGIYIKIWALLFVLSTCSYLVDYFNFEVLLFMLMKAGLIVAVFMHMMWERLALLYAIMVPPILVMVFVFLMTHEADNTFSMRGLFFGAGP